KKIHSNPELGFEEKKACKWQLEILKELGFKIENPFCGLDTAYKATKGKGKPNIAFLAEYDALPDIGHACGHNLIAPCSIAAAEALYKALEKSKIDGTVTLFGTPAEEGKGGKVKIAEKQGFKDIELFLMAHPSYVTSEYSGFLAIRRFFVEFFGKSSHASASPEEGLNALDAVTLLFAGINAMRQHFKDKTRIHGIINSGGSAPNIIPDYTSATFYLRSPTEKYLKVMIQKFRKIVEGAALMTGVKSKITEGKKDSYKAGLVVNALNRDYIELAREIGLEKITDKKDELGSSDFGNVSQIAPGLHAYFCACRENYPLHSKKFRDNAVKVFAIESMFKAAEAIANIGLKFCIDKKYREEIRTEFEKNKKNMC
ncbi:MAG TPA: M20 family metallopeptidase, partial [Victivallales bacterium]|nr:M20 family metallopeptidase [Victivallales bacterium]